MFVNVLSGLFSFRFILPIIALLSAGGYGYYMHSNKGGLRTQLEIANARIATFNAEMIKHIDELNDRNEVIVTLEKEIEKKDKIHAVTQETINDLSSKNVELSSLYRSTVGTLEQIQSKYENENECFNENIPNDVLDVINSRVRIDTDSDTDS